MNESTALQVYFLNGDARNETDWFRAGQIRLPQNWGSVEYPELIQIGETFYRVDKTNGI